jgi:hypothetical protein
VLAEFDNSKRSCRKRLTEHNRRRRKPASAQDKEDSSPPPKRADTTTYNDSDHKSKHTTAIYLFFERELMTVRVREFKSI